MKVKCINIRPAVPDHISVDSIYYIDETKMSDDYVEWYIPVYKDENFTMGVGNLKLSHFTRIE